LSDDGQLLKLPIDRLNGPEGDVVAATTGWDPDQQHDGENHAKLGASCVSGHHAIVSGGDAAGAGRSSL
jgi:hypothetical protein